MYECNIINNVAFFLYINIIGLYFINISFILFNVIILIIIVKYIYLVQNMITNESVIQNRIIDTRSISWSMKFGLLCQVQAKKIMKSPMLIFGVIGIPIIIMLGIGVMVPAANSLCATFGITGIVGCGLIFGDLWYSVENSTMKASLGSSNVGRKTKIFSVGLVSFVASIISITLLTMMFIALESSGILFLNSFVFLGDSHFQSINVIWKNINWLNFIYFQIINITLAIALFTFAKDFLKTNKTFVMVLFSYVIMDIVFGGVMSNLFNMTVIEIDESGAINSTGYLYDFKIMSGESDSFLNWTSWYSYTKFTVPHYFLNQQFFLLFRVGSVQSAGAFYFDAAGNYHFNWDLGIENPSEFVWMLHAQNLIFGTDYTSMDNLLGNEQFMVEWNNLIAASASEPSLLDGAYEAFYYYNKSLPVDTSFFKPYNGDFTLVWMAITPYFYIIGLTIFGFLFRKD